jgi:hypothetical protein
MSETADSYIAMWRSLYRSMLYTLYSGSWKMATKPLSMFVSGTASQHNTSEK